MCGITGWFSTQPQRFGPESGEILRGMRDRLLHRGPDDFGDHIEVPEDVQRLGGVALGFRRLSILDLAGGHQPMGSPDGTVWVVFNGEIYNHLDLRKELEAAGYTFATRSDTEVLVHGWQHWGLGLFPKLSGMFGVGIWDARKRSLVLARDPMGKKPVFATLCDQGRTLVFGSELSAVLAHPAVEPRIDAGGLQSLILMDYVASPRAIVQGVETLQPGCLWHVTVGAHGGLRVARDCYAPPTRPNAELALLTEQDALRELDQRISRAVERRLMADVPLGIFLSGGIDSSLVAYYAARHRPARELDTFSIGFEDKSFDESAHARTVAQHLGTRHHERTFDPQACLDLAPKLLASIDQPLADASILPTWFLCGFAREQVTVALGGDGGDEWFLGYPTFYADPVARLADRLGLAHVQPWLAAIVQKLPVSHGNLSLDFQLKRFVAGLGYQGGLRHIAWIGGLEPRQHGRVLAADALQELHRHEETTESSISEVWRQWQSVARDDADALAGLYARYYLGDGVLQKVDRASMLHSLEVRAPLLDRDVVELARALPTRMKLRGRTTKWLLRKLAEDKLPPHIVKRPKKGFGVPIAAWLRGPLRGWMTDVLSEERLRRAPFLNVTGIQGLVKEHLDGRADHRKVLWALLCYCVWQEKLARQ